MQAATIVTLGGIGEIRQHESDLSAKQKARCMRAFANLGSATGNRLSPYPDFPLLMGKLPLVNGLRPNTDSSQSQYQWDFFMRVFALCSSK
jgi:hypothetical protein